MIPKIIHYCWLSDEPFPKKIESCIETWRKILPDYEIRKWDFKRFPKDKSIWVSEAFDKRKYAFAADYIRNYALYTEGGIYLDSDVEVLKSFDPLLHLPYFLCFENGTGDIEAAVQGSEPGNQRYKIMLDYYENRHFVNEDGSLNTEPLPKLMTKYWDKYTINPIDNPSEFDASSDVISLFPFEYFSPIHLEHRQLQQTDRTMAIHRFAGTWQPKKKKIKKAIKRLIGPKLTQIGISLKRKLTRKKR